MALHTPHKRKRRPWRWRSLCGLTVFGAILVTTWLAVTAWKINHHYTVVRPRQLQQARHFVLTQANHQLIVDECRMMLANPVDYYLGGSSFPKTTPPYLATLGATSITIDSNDGVRICFDREFQLYVPVVRPTNTPPPPTPGQQIAPGLWFIG